MNQKVLIGIIATAIIVLLGTGAYMALQPTTTDTTSGDTPAGSTGSDASSSETAAEEAVAPATAATITYTDSGFRPSTITVKKGSTITVTNNSAVNVMFSSADHPTHVMQPELNMDMLKPGESGTVTVTKVGTWGYHDHIDESMIGRIVVTE